MTTKTFGRLQYGTHVQTGAAAWGLDVEPHIAMKVKRMFPRAWQGRAATITLADTPEVARDLEWFLLRFPLQISEKSRERLTARADEHRAREQAIEDILAGRQARLTGWIDPSREARDYQTIGADFAWTARGCIIGDDVGLGKTQTGLLVLRDPDTLPALVVTLTHLTRQWQREIAAVFPMLVTHIAKTTTPKPVDADVIIMNYHKLNGWRDHLSGQIRTVIFDEVQELRKDGTAKYDAAAHIADKADWRIGLSATPVYNYGDETHTIYQVLAPDVLGSRTEFIREWGGAYYGANVAIEDPRGLGTYLRDQGLMIRRTRKDVKREIKEPIKIMQEVPSNPEVIDDVKGDLAVLAKMLMDSSTEGREKMRLGGEISWKLRQATGIAKAPFVAEFAKLLLESEEAIVLFGWHRTVYDIWLDALRDYNPLMFTGSESATQKDKVAQAFIGGDSRVLLMSLRAGAGLDGLQKRSSCAVFGELDWSPAMHDQAIGRLARDGQESAVAAYFCVTGYGSDPAIAETLQIKNQQGEGIRNPDQDALFGSNIGSPDKSRTRMLLEAVGITLPEHVRVPDAPEEKP